MNSFGMFRDLKSLVLGARVSQKKAVKIAGGSDVCLSSSSFLMEYSRIMGLHHLKGKSH